MGVTRRWSPKLLLSMAYPLLEEQMDKADEYEGIYRFSRGDVGNAIRDTA